MGGKVSMLPEPPTNFPFFVFDFRTRDTIQLAMANMQIIEVITSAIEFMWTSGVERQGRLKDGSYEIHFFSSLFSHNSYHICCILMKRVICKILMELYQLGWQPVVSSSLSRTSKLSTWFFYKFRTKLKPKPIVCLSLSSGDRVQLINAPEHLKRALKEAVEESYDYGMSEEFKYGDDFEIKLKGKPWNSYVFEEGVWARKLILEIIRKFSDLGFQFYTTANMTGNTDCLFFVPREQWKLHGVEYFVLSLNQTDKIRLVSAQEEIIEVCREVIASYWPKGIQQAVDLNITYEFQLKGNPWVSTDEDTVASRILMAKLYENLLKNGWRVLTGLSISQRNNDKGVFIMRSCEKKVLLHAAMSLNRNDRLRMIQFDEEEQKQITENLRNHWPYGVQKLGNYFGSTEIKLKGNNLNV